MRAVVITRHGPPEVLQVQERPVPRAGPEEVLIGVSAAGINFADLMARLGLYPDAPKPPCVVGYEVSGTIAELGDGVDGNLRIGQRVVAPDPFRRVRRVCCGSLGRRRRTPRSREFRARRSGPDCLRDGVGGPDPCGQSSGGERVLIQAAAGGVGIAATQIAKRAGAEVWGTSSPAKHGAIRGFGVDHPLDYTNSGWERGLPKLDLVMDALGGASFRRSYGLLRAGGRLVCFGASGVVSGESRNLLAAARTALQMPRFNMLKQMSDSKTVIGLNVLSIWDEFQSADRWTKPLTELLADGTVQPVLAKAFPFAQAPDAHRFISERRNIGKVVLTPGGLKRLAALAAGLRSNQLSADFTIVPRGPYERLGLAIAPRG